MSRQSGDEQPRQPFEPPQPPPPTVPTPSMPEVARVPLISPPPLPSSASPAARPAPLSSPPAPPGHRPHPASGYQPYAPPQYLFRPQVRVNGLCVASLVLGIVGVTCFLLYAVPSVLAVVFGLVGLGQVDRSGGAESGRGLAIAGVVLGVVGASLVVFLLVVAARSWDITDFG